MSRMSHGLSLLLLALFVVFQSATLLAQECITSSETDSSTEAQRARWEGSWAVQDKDNLCVFWSELNSAFETGIQLPPVPVHLDPSMTRQIQIEIARQKFRECMTNGGAPDPERAGVVLALNDIFDLFCKCNGEVFETEFTCYKTDTSEWIDKQWFKRWNERRKEGNECIAFLAFGFPPRVIGGVLVSGHAVTLTGAKENAEGGYDLKFRDPYYPNIQQEVSLAETAISTHLLDASFPARRLQFHEKIEFDQIRAIYFKCPRREKVTEATALED